MGMHFSPDMLPILISYIDLAINVASMVVGLVVIYLVVEMDRFLGGNRIRNALTYFIVGICLDVFGVAWLILFGHGDLVMGSVHDLLVTLGMIFFIVSIYKFAALVLPIKPTTETTEVPLVETYGDSALKAVEHSDST